MHPHEAIIRRVFEEVWTGGMLDVIPDLYTEDFVAHYAHPPAWPLGPAGVRSVAETLHREFSNYREEIKDLFLSLPDRAAVRIEVSGTQTGSLGSAPASGREVRFGEIILYRFRDSKICEQWGVPDLLTMYSQLGGTPSFDSAA